jgi:hypothetical protein
MAASQPAGLLSVLLNSSASLSERDDAAGDLADYEDALPTLISVAMTANEDNMIVNSCGISIGEIWKRLGCFDQAIFDKLPRGAQSEISSLLNL